MQEKEKMLQGILYDANYDEALRKDRANCKLLCQEYNQINYEDEEEDNSEIIKKRTELLLMKIVLNLSKKESIFTYLIFKKKLLNVSLKEKK